MLKVIDDIKDKFDMIILDPPRDGINPKALQKIIAVMREIEIEIDSLISH